MAVKIEKNKESITYFQEDSSFKGILNFVTPLCILGKYNGEIFGESTLQVGSKAVVEANISVKKLVLYGKIVGNIYASEKVELKLGSVLSGNIKTPNLEIDEGVIFEGQCEMKKIDTPKKS